MNNIIFNITYIFIYFNFKFNLFIYFIFNCYLLKIINYIFIFTLKFNNLKKLVIKIFFWNTIFKIKLDFLFYNINWVMVFLFLIIINLILSNFCENPLYLF